MWLNNFYLFNYYKEKSLGILLWNVVCWLNICWNIWINKINGNYVLKIKLIGWIWKMLDLKKFVNGYCKIGFCNIFWVKIGIDIISFKCKGEVMIWL